MGAAMEEHHLSGRVRVGIDADSHVAEVVLDRAAKMNAVDLEMFEALGEAADLIAAQSSVRAVVLRGSGGNFCAGIDLSVLGSQGQDLAEALQTPVAPSIANLFQRAAYAWRELPIPVICALEGVTYGAGVQIALAADIRYAAKDASFAIMEAKWGIIPDMGLTTTLRHLMTPDRVKELSWSARIFDSQEAHALGLVTATVDDPVAESRRFAAVCAGKSPDVVRGIKTLVNEGWQAPEAEALALEARLQAGIIGGKNQREAVAANLEKRKPDFQD